jgi:hypothetical protein
MRPRQDPRSRSCSARRAPCLGRRMEPLNGRVGLSMAGAGSRRPWYRISVTSPEGWLAWLPGEGCGPHQGRNVGYSALGRMGMTRRMRASRQEQVGGAGQRGLSCLRAPGRGSSGELPPLIRRFVANTKPTQVRWPAKINTRTTRTKRHSPVHGGTTAKMSV